MNVLGAFCLGYYVVMILSMGFADLMPEYNRLEKTSMSGCYMLITFALSIYLGLRGGKLSARHYVEEGYECVTKDGALLTLAKAKWGLEL
jgi:hypothetical protein